MQIRQGDFDDSRVIGLLRVHVTTARENTEICSAHALDESGLKAPGIDFWAAWDGTELLGIGALREITPGHGEIKSMHVEKSRRRNGAGAAMLQHIIGAARKKGMRRLSLETGASDYFIAARALYRKHGFSECPPFGDYASDLNSIFMTLELK